MRTLKGDGYIVDMLHYTEPPRPLSDRQPLPPPRIPIRTKTPRHPLRLPAIPVAAATATRWPMNRTASGSPATATSASSSIPSQLGEIAAKAPRHLQLAAGGGTRAATRPPVSKPGNGPAESTTSSPVPTSIRKGSPSPASAAVALPPTGSPPRRPCESRRPRQRHGDLEAYVSNRVYQRPLRLHVPLQRLPVALDAHRRPDRCRVPLALHQQRPGRDLPDGRQRPHQSTALERAYSLYGPQATASTRWSASAATPTARTSRQGAYRFINTHLKNDPRPVTDSEIDNRQRRQQTRPYPIAPDPSESSPTDNDIPADQLNTKIDEVFVPIARVEAPAAGQHDAWKRPLLASLRQTTFPSTTSPRTIPAANQTRRSRRDDGPNAIRRRHRVPPPFRAPARGRRQACCSSS